MSRYLQHLEKGNELFEKCIHSHNGQWCGFDGYPIIDCLNCKNYKEKELCERQKNRININKDEVTFVSKEELGEMGTKLFGSNVAEKEN